MPKKQKINLFIFAQDSSALGGAEHLLANLAKRFVKEKVNVIGIVSYAPFGENLEKTGVLVNCAKCRLDIAGGIKGLIKFIFQFPFLLPFYLRIFKSFKKNKNTIILASGFTDKILASLFGSIFSLKVIWLEHGPVGELFRRNLYIPKILYLWGMTKIQKIIVPSQYTKKSLFKDTNVERNRIIVIHNGIEILDYKKLKFYKEKKKYFKGKHRLSKYKVIGLVSRLQKEKGQDTLIKSMPLISKKIKNVKLIFIGEGAWKKNLLLLAKKNKVSDSIKYFGYVDEKTKFELISAMDVFVFPTRWKMEGFGLAVCEAMLLGTPVIGSNFGPVPEVVNDAGILVKPNTQEMSKSIVHLLNNQKVMNLLSKKGNIRVQKCFNIERTAEEYMRLFQKMLN